MVHGLHASHELIHPTELLGAAARAAQAGFGTAMSSDRFSPWRHRQVNAALKLTGLDTPCLLKDVLVDGSKRVAKDGSATLELKRYGCRWLRVERQR